MYGPSDRELSGCVRVLATIFALVALASLAVGWLLGKYL